jgi:hypothetical protein
MSLLPLPRYQALDANGQPMPGAKLATYAAGTTTPLATYSDSARTIVNTNPIIADASGLFPSIYLGDLAYKIDLRFADGSVRFIQDNVVGSFDSTSTTINATTLDGFDSAAFVFKSGPLRFTGAITVNLTGDTHNLNPVGGETAVLWRLSATVACTLTGIVAQPVGTWHFLWNGNTPTVTLPVSNASSALGNRFLTPNNVNVVLTTFCGVWIFYDESGSWVVGGA